MNRSFYRIASLLTLLCFLTVVARSQDSHLHKSQSGKSSNWAELIGSMEKMHVAMSAVQPSGNSDADFVRLMIPHHQAAIDMAKAQLKSGTDPQMRRMAQEIITDQQSEIELMRLWLKEHAETPAAVAPNHHSLPKENLR